MVVDWGWFRTRSRTNLTGNSNGRGLQYFNAQTLNL
jgi:hypothetical protein